MVEVDLTTETRPSRMEGTARNWRGVPELRFSD